MKLSRHGPLLAATLVAGLLALSSCLPTAPSATQEAMSQFVDIDPPASISLVASKLIDGRLGGVIIVGNWKLIVPAGAFDGAGTITLSVPDPSITKCDLEISPSSLNHFENPVDLRYLCTSITEAESRNMQWWDPAAQAWKQIPSWVEKSDTSRCAELEHFSTYRTGKAGWSPQE